MKTTLVPLFLAVLAASAAVDVENPVCEGFTLEGYLDARYQEYGAYNQVPSREFSIRRAGLEAKAEITGNLEAELKLEFRPDEMFLKDAFLQWDPLSGIQGRFGLFRGETILGGELSTWELPFYERPLVYDLREDLTYSTRDLGLDVELELPQMGFLQLAGTAGIFNGDERGDVRSDNELLYSFRGTAEIIPANMTLGLSAVSHRMGMADQSVPSGYRSSERLMAFSGDLSFHHSFSNWYDGTIYAEASTGDNWNLCDVLAGEDPPRFLGYWGGLTFNYHPWTVQTIRTISLSLGYDHLEQDTEMDWKEKRVSLIASVYPTENTRVRFGGVRTTMETLLSSDEYTDIILEAGLRF